MQHTWVSVDSVVVDDRRKRDLGDLTALTKSIKVHGLMNPIVVIKKSHRLVSGWRRLEAVRSLGKKNIEAYIVDNAIDAVDLIAQEGVSPEYFKEMVWSEKVALGLIIEDLDEPRNEFNKINARLKGAESRYHGKFGAVYKKKEYPPTRRLIGALLNCSPQMYGIARRVYLAAHDMNASQADREQGLRAVEYMDKANSPSGGRAILQGHARILNDDHRAIALGSANDQRMIFENARPILAGLLHGFGEVADIHPQLSKEEVTRWMNDLSNARREVERLINKMRRFVRDG